MVVKWIQKAIKRPGSLHRSLGIPKDKKIPVVLMRRIVSAKAGDVITNPTGVGRKKIKVTRRLEQRANMALNLRRLKKR